MSPGNGFCDIESTHQGCPLRGSRNEPPRSLSLNPAELINFTLTSLFPTGATACSLTGGTASTTAGCDYLLALGDSLSAPGSTSLFPTGWIGFSDGATTTDADFQDLAVLVTERVPEPGSLSLLAAGLIGLGFMFRQKKVRG